MTTEIRVDPLGLEAAASLLKRDVAAYCSYRMRPLWGYLPLAGVADHDGRLALACSSALTAYLTLLESDAHNVDSLGQAMQNADIQAARGMG